MMSPLLTQKSATTVPRYTSLTIHFSHGVSSQFSLNQNTAHLSPLTAERCFFTALLQNKLQ